MCVTVYCIAERDLSYSRINVTNTLQCSVLSKVVATRCKAWVYGHSLAGICGFVSRRGRGCLSVVSAVCSQVAVSTEGRSLVQWSPTECVSVCLTVISKPHQ